MNLMPGNTFGQIIGISACSGLYGGWPAVYVGDVPSGDAQMRDDVRNELEKLRPGPVRRNMTIFGAMTDRYKE